jgi:hypothetical protein
MDDLVRNRDEKQYEEIMLFILPALFLLRLMTMIF